MSKERPILFNGDMVRAILDGRKTQTRRLLSPKSLRLLNIAAAAGECHELGFVNPISENDQATMAQLCPYGQPGDRLWVRETFWMDRRQDTMAVMDTDGACTYSPKDPKAFIKTPRAPMLSIRSNGFWRKRPSIHMPRWASRILLEVVSVRVERLNDISETDAMAEGVKNSLHLHGGRFAKENFAHLWWTINGDGSWEANHWVWVVEFRRVEQ